MRTGIQSETLVIAKDSLGRLWATWTLQSGAGNLVYTNHSAAGDDTDWSNPVALPFSAATSALDDISSVIAFTVSGGVADRRLLEQPGRQEGLLRLAARRRFRLGLDARDGARHIEMAARTQPTTT